MQGILESDHKEYDLQQFFQNLIEESTSLPDTIKSCISNWYYAESGDYDELIQNFIETACICLEYLSKDEIKEISELLETNIELKAIEYTLN